MLPSRLAVAALGLLPAVRAQEAPGQPEFFEREVRPLLAKRCFGCHGPDKQKSDLRLDHIAHIKRGGDRGPAIVAGDPAASRLVHAIGYQDPDLQMPPKRRLAAPEIAVLRRWVEIGAPWPDEPVPEKAPERNAFDLDARRAAHWSWQPLHQPALPPANDWSAAPIDRFVHRGLVAAGLTPADPADKATLLRRVTFDLTGLPPTLDEQAAFAADPRPEAYAAVVDRLLASPHFGERWGRHWLDLVRFAESLGHEFDYPLPGAHRYRDYVIRAFNDDLPYDQLVREHIAGDLLPVPRRDENGEDVSAIATAFYWFVEQSHSPVDVRKAQADRTDNQVDVLSKTFLGLTLACARCHDHKFDAISTKDYYAMCGFIKSSRYMQLDISPPDPADVVARYLRASADLTRAWSAALPDRLQDVRTRMLDAARHPTPPQRGRKQRKPEPGDDLLRERWREALGDPQVQRDRLHPLHAFAALRAGGDLGRRWLRATEGARVRDDAFAADGAVPFADFRSEGFERWFRSGRGFADGPTTRPFLIPGRDGRARVQTGRWAYSGRRGQRGMGVLHSPTFRIDKRYVHVLAFGRESRIKIVLEGHHLIRAPIYGQLKQLVNDEAPRWYTADLEMWRGKRAFIALCDQSAPDLADAARGNGYAPDGYLAVQQVWFSDQRRTPDPDAAYPAFVLGDDAGASLGTVDALVDRHVDLLAAAVRGLADGALDAHGARLLSFFWERGLLGPEPAAARRQLDAAEAALRPAALVPGLADGTGEDESVFIRGGHNNPGSVVPRRTLQALGGTAHPPVASGQGSGRLLLAERLLAADDPFPARVMVNRIWHHLFGRGLVATVDNFGVLGEPPSHPALLDWLALRFRGDGWSIKRAIRRVVLSRTYRQASTPSPRARADDPTNRWLSHMPVRRLTAEAVRDAILTTSGRLDPAMSGPSVHVPVDRFMEGGRGRPRSGPVDGAGRRSVYLRVGRNFLSPFLLAFDFPRPFSTIGRRNVTNVPAQALALLNDPFVRGQAEVWAGRLLADEGTVATRIDRAWRQAFGRAPSADEVARLQAFVGAQARAHGCGEADPAPWRDLCHALFNTKEFVFVR